ncbi:MAG: rRNA maturation RNase YbeY [Acidimicrobiia bacterium]|nr:rRNA maturation RNase YbeY [Acidimicrobiia bacterium]MBV9041953.1 rRNA maturation RNase YbeY [Acidimicrobiia bacterium]MBV9283344.1 rRNA maturation RNase YbeY [Acidimicrobiia bacterium]
MTIDVFAADEQKDEPVDTMRWVRLAKEVLAAEGVKGEVELSMLFVDEHAIAELNERFLDETGPTDVLAFPMDDHISEGGRSPDSGGSGPGVNPEPTSEAPTMLGDLVLCPAVAKRNAAGASHGYDDEMALLVVHGILHLLGMDHADAEEATAMQRRERELLGRFHKQP